MIWYNIIVEFFHHLKFFSNIFNFWILWRVKNELPYQAATVHWHGILQSENFWMDGAAFISQCPILPYSTFVYSWTAENSGTHWYHSHMSNQRLDGIFGAIIIEKPKDTEKSIPIVISGKHQSLSHHKIFL